MCQHIILLLLVPSYTWCHLTELVYKALSAPQAMLIYKQAFWDASPQVYAHLQAGFGMPVPKFICQHIVILLLMEVMLI
jgi:hypothetical protein